LIPSDDRSNQILYNLSQSTTAQQVPGLSFNISYEDVGDWAAGIVITETVTIGGVTVADMPMGVATALGPVEIVNAGYSGIMGMAFESENFSERGGGPTGCGSGPGSLLT
jgi:hypothetical protein